MMKTHLRIAIVVAFIPLAAGAAALDQGRRATEPTNGSLPDAQTAPVPAPAPEPTAAPAAAARLPRLLDLGATRCIPCKMMAPVLEKLKKEYDGRMEVEFIDVWQNPDAGKQHKIELIPTQIFYSATGKELFRHVGFYGREDILAKWKELGVDLGRKPAPAESGKPSAASSADKTKRD